MEIKLRDQVAINMLAALYAQYWEDSRNGRLVPGVEVYRKRLIEEAYDWADMVVKIREEKEGSNRVRNQRQTPTLPAAAAS